MLQRRHRRGCKTVKVYRCALFAYVFNDRSPSIVNINDACRLGSLLYSRDPCHYRLNAMCEFRPIILLYI